MTKQFQVSVTIPVFNAADFVQRAVESALIQPQTAEVVLVEDYSSDNSWQVCQQIASEHNPVRIFRPADGRNHGCSASRSLAVQKSSCEYIAFLDADDFYLPGRFDAAEQMFAVDPQLDGVYEAIGMHVEDEDSMQRWKDSGGAITSLTTMTKCVPPEELFTKLVTGGSGTFHINGLVVKRNIFEKTGYFDEILPLHMDDVFFIKAAGLTKLAPGRLNEPVAMRRVHDHNRISAPRPKKLIYEMRLKFWFTIWDWSRSHLSQEKQAIILHEMIHYAGNSSRFYRSYSGLLHNQQKRIQLLLLLSKYPGLIFESLFWNSFFAGPHNWLNGMMRKRS
jgi:Glycosyltransferases involved in cell wall biogenesis